MRQVGEVAYESFMKGVGFIMFSTYLASRRSWDNSSAHQRSFPIGLGGVVGVGYEGGTETSESGN
jgi:hypothetical protein